MSERSIRVVRPADKVKTIFAAGDDYRFLATGEDTDGQYILVEAMVPPGGGPPFHIQTREEEAFYILEGSLTFWGSGTEFEAGPGTYVNIPKGAKHRFENKSQSTVKMLFFFAPAGIEGLFDEFTQLENLGGNSASLIDALKKLGRKYGVEYLVD